jgi:hypothetical protein
MQAALVRAADVHAGAAPYSFTAAQHLNIIGGISGNFCFSFLFIFWFSHEKSSFTGISALFA